MEPVVSLLADLVRIPSMNPMGRARSGREYAEGDLADYVATYLRRQAVDVEVFDVTPGRPDVLGYIDARADRTLLLEAHLDTVQAENVSNGVLQPSITAGKVFGRGACDTKGAIASFLHGVCGYLAAGRRPKFNVVLLFVADEEYRFTGAQAAVAHGLRADFGIVGEPTRLHIVRAHKGVTRWKITTHGVAAHSAYPDRGDNAIYTMAHVVARLEDYADTLAHEMHHPLLGSPTISVGVIEGGEAVNIVPDRCWIEIDRRTLPGETAASVVSPVRDLLREVSRWEFEPPHLSVAGMEVPQDSPVVRILSEAICRSGQDVTVEVAHYATDAGVYNTEGIPAVVFGPGDIAQAHTNDEFIEVDQLDRAVRIITTLIS